MQKKHISSKSARHLRSALWNKLTVKRTSIGTRATSACLYIVDWELITKVNLRFVLSTLQAVNQAGLVTHTTECSSCSPRSTETYLAPGDCPQWQPAENSSAPRQLFQAKSPVFSGHWYSCIIKPLSVPVVVAKPGEDMKTAIIIEGRLCFEV